MMINNKTEHQANKYRKVAQTRRTKMERKIIESESSDEEYMERKIKKENNRSSKDTETVEESDRISNLYSESEENLISEDYSVYSQENDDYKTNSDNTSIKGKNGNREKNCHDKKNIELEKSILLKTLKVFIDMEKEIDNGVTAYDSDTVVRRNKKTRFLRKCSQEAIEKDLSKIKSKKIDVRTSRGVLKINDVNFKKEDEIEIKSGKKVIEAVIKQILTNYIKVKTKNNVKMDIFISDIKNSTKRIYKLEKK